MNLKQIKKYWRTRHESLNEKINKLTEQRVRELVSKLGRFKINSICMAMGCWSLIGAKILVRSTEEDETFKVDLDEMQYWADNPNRFTWEPINVTKEELKTWQELVKLCDWLLNTTGGIDIEL